MKSFLRFILLTVVTGLLIYLDFRFVTIGILKWIIAVGLVIFCLIRYLYIWEAHAAAKGKKMYSALQQVEASKKVFMGIGAVYLIADFSARGVSVENLFYLFSPEIKKNPALRKRHLSNHWGIEDNSSAIEAMDELLMDGFSKSPQYIEDAEMNNLNYLAWDLERLGSVARWSLNLGYINEDEYWRYMKTANKLMIENYIDWQEYIDGYVGGLKFWTTSTNQGTLGQTFMLDCESDAEKLMNGFPTKGNETAFYSLIPFEQIKINL